MSQVSVSVRPVSRRRVFAYALVACLVPAGTAFAQSAPYVRVTRDQLEIKSSQLSNGTTLMVAPRGTVFEVVHTQGDRYEHREGNVYWVLVPPDTWGVQRLGWIDGKNVEPGPPMVRARPAEVRPLISRSGPGTEAVNPATVEPTPMAAVAAPAAPAAEKAPIADIVLNFEFNRSDLTTEAQAKLVEAVSLLKSNTQTLSFALEGHADWTGPETYNEKLGLARADAVKRALCDQHQIPTDKVSIVSYGEVQPATSNATKEGRAQNRRVVIKVSN